MKMLHALSAAGLAMSIAVPAAAAPAATVRASSAWSRPAAQGGVGVGYVTLTNDAAVADGLVGASSSWAASVEVHRTEHHEGMASMKAVPLPMPLPAGKTTPMQAGGLHLMLMGLKRPIKAGDKVPVRLVFSRSAPVETTMSVTLLPPR